MTTGPNPPSTKNWKPDTSGDALPKEFEQMRQVAMIPRGPDWFAEQGVSLHEAEIEPGWTVQTGTVLAKDGPFLVVGEPGGDSVDLYARMELTPRLAAAKFVDAMGPEVDSTVTNPLD